MLQTAGLDGLGAQPRLEHGSSRRTAAEFQLQHFEKGGGVQHRHGEAEMRNVFGRVFERKTERDLIGGEGAGVELAADFAEKARENERRRGSRSSTG